MQNASFDSVNLDDYTLDIREVLEDYAIYKDTWKENYSIHEGTMKNSTQKVKIYRRLFPTDSTSKERFRVLMTAFNQGIVLADNIFLSHEDGGNEFENKTKNFRAFSLCCGTFVYGLEQQIYSFISSLGNQYQLCKEASTFSKSRNYHQKLT